MPFVRIDFEQRDTSGFAADVGALVHQAMVEALGIPDEDCFQVLTQHPRGRGTLVFDAGYLGVRRTPDVVFVQITLAAGRTVDQKEGLFRRIADLLHDGAGLRREDVLVSLVETEPSDWSFGNGEAQYARSLPPHLRNQGR